MCAQKLSVVNPKSSTIASKSYIKDETHSFQFLLSTDQKKFSKIKKEITQLSELITTCHKNISTEQEFFRHHLKQQQQKTTDLMYHLQRQMESEHKEYLQELEEFEKQTYQQQPHLESSNHQLESDNELDTELAQCNESLILLGYPDKTKCKCQEKHEDNFGSCQPKLNSNELGSQVFQCLQNLKLLEEETVNE